MDYRSGDKINDVVKALCFLTGMRYEDTTSLYDFMHSFNQTKDNKMEFGRWYEWGFFRIKGFKKGTMHFEFTNENVWMEFNTRVAKIKGWQLPKKTDKKHKGTERTSKAGLEVFQKI